MKDFIFVALMLAEAVSRAALAWQSAPGCRYSELSVRPGTRSGFVVMAPGEAGISFTNFLSEERGLTNQIFHNGGGVALGDVDGDGWCDLYLANIDGRGALYRNLGNWKFQDVTAASGLTCAEIPTTGVLFADIDGDGDLDLIVNSIGRGTLVFLNDGQGRFADATSRAGTANRAGSMSAALADVDGDGLLDLYVANYRTSTLRDEPFTRFTVNITNGQNVVAAVNGKSASAPELLGRFTVDERGAIIEHGEADVLFHNDGGGHFTPVPWNRGAFQDENGNPISIPYDFGLSVMMRDLNGDGAPDIYVCNDFDSEDRIWINRGDGGFRLIPRLAIRQTSLFSMGVDVADVDRDGFDDIFVADMLSREHARRMVQLGDRRANATSPGVFTNRPQSMRNTLLWNRGDGTYSEVARFAGIEASEWSWTPIFVDVDLDGYEDLLISNGHLRDGQNVDYVRRLQALKRERSMSALEQLHLRKLFPRLDNRSAAYRNLGNLRFEDMSAAWNFNTLGVKQGMALADLDNDGDLDVVANSLNGPALIYRNDAEAPRLAVRLKGKEPNTRGVGARIRVFGGPVVQSQEMICGGRYLSGDDFMRVFAAGSLSNNLTIEVTWRSGKRTTIHDARGNRIYEINEEGAQPATRESLQMRKSRSWFSDVSALLAHTHHEEDFDEFARQPLLVRKLGQAGPGVSWFDVDNDGFEDLLVASGRGGALGVFRSNGRGGFEKLARAPFNAPVTTDQSAVIGTQIGAHRVVIAGSCHYEDGLATGRAARIYDLSTSNVLDELPEHDSSIGPLALADVDGDGALDLFVGGRVVPGRYPQAASSLLFRREHDKWVPDAENSAILKNVGLVTSALFSDLDGDGWPDLILACEWGPLRLFHNDHGKLIAWNPPLTAGTNNWPSTVSQLTGWWNSVAAGDFDGDGRMDIVAGNWGENTGYETSEPQPLRVYFGDFNGDGILDLLEARYDSSLRKIVPLRDPTVVFRALPYLTTRYPTFEAYGRASVGEVIGPSANAQELAITTLRCMVFLNRGTNFDLRVLPREAQLSPIFGIGVADFDGDGTEDLFLAQNFFGVDGITSRYDAGRGVLLRGNGDGSFRAISSRESGIAVYGEGRGVAVCDYDADGRVDICVGQNGAATRLYHNEGAEPGLRVRLQGPADNPQAVGAVLRPFTATLHGGAAREIHAGSGWLSQDSAVQVFAPRSAVESIRIRWPGGKTSQVPIPHNARAVTVDYSARLIVE